MAEAFTYCWTDIKLNKLYVGWHKGSIDDGYICSSKLMLEEYNKRPNDFKREIIATGSSLDMISLELSILNSENAKLNEDYYNMHNGNGLYRLGSHTEDTKKKISKSKRGTKRPDVSERNKIDLNPAKKGLCSRDTSGEKNPMFGVTHTKESKNKMSLNRKGKGTQPKSEDTKRKMAEARREYWAKRKGQI